MSSWRWGSLPGIKKEQEENSHVLALPSPRSLQGSGVLEQEGRDSTQGRGAGLGHSGLQHPTRSMMEPPEATRLKNRKNNLEIS